MDDKTARDVRSKPASEHPDWKWVVMDETWMIMTEWHRRASYCDPDNFDMHIYSDWLGYGSQELQENLVSWCRIVVKYVADEVLARQVP